MKTKTTYVYKYRRLGLDIIYEATFNSHSEAENTFLNTPEYVEPHYHKAVVTFV